MTNLEATEDGDCDSSREGFDADTDECASTDTCGTLTFDGDSVLGCFPTADCDAGVLAIPDTTASEATLVCGAAKLAGAFVAAVAVAASI